MNKSVTTHLFPHQERVSHSFMIKALLSAINKTLKDKFTAEDKKAWEVVFSFMVAKMTVSIFNSECKDEQLYLEINSTRLSINYFDTVNVEFEYA